MSKWSVLIALKKIKMTVSTRWTLDTEQIACNTTLDDDVIKQTAQRNHTYVLNYPNTFICMYLYTVYYAIWHSHLTIRWLEEISSKDKQTINHTCHFSAYYFVSTVKVYNVYFYRSYIDAISYKSQIHEVINKSNFY